MIKHPTCARVLRIILIALFISAIMVLAPSFAIHSYAQVIPCPLMNPAAFRLTSGVSRATAAMRIPRCRLP